MTVESRVKIATQAQFWNQQHRMRSNEFTLLAKQPSAFAEECVDYLPNKAKVLELGCATGRDAAYFVRSKNCQVIGVDISLLPLQQQVKDQADEIKNINRVNAATPNLPFDMTKPLFDAFYARSAIYLDDTSFISFLKKIKSALKTGGYIMLQGKTASSEDIAVSHEIGENLVKDHDGHIRRIWDLLSTIAMLENIGFKIIETNSHNEQWTGQNKKFISIIAIKND